MLGPQELQNLVIKEKKKKMKINSGERGLGLLGRIFEDTEQFPLSCSCVLVHKL